MTFPQLSFQKWFGKKNFIFTKENESNQVININPSRSTASSPKFKNKHCFDVLITFDDIFLTLPYSCMIWIGSRSLSWDLCHRSVCKKSADSVPAEKTTLWTHTAINTRITLLQWLNLTKTNKKNKIMNKIPTSLNWGSAFASTAF